MKTAYYAGRPESSVLPLPRLAEPLDELQQRFLAHGVSFLK